MTKSSYKQMLIESLIDISSMTSYKGPAEKVLDAKDEKFETHRSATSEVDVLGRAYAGQDDWDNKFITENNDMDEENVAQGEPNVKVTLPDGHDPDVTDLEDNIDESDPDKKYQEPITGEEDAKSKLNVEGIEDPVSDETTEDDDEEDQEDDGVVTEPTDGIPTQDEFQNSDPEIATEGDEELGEDLPEDEPIEDEPVEDFSDEDDEIDGSDLPEDEPIEEAIEDGEVITDDPNEPYLGDDLPEDEPPAGDFPEEHLDEGDEELGEDLPEDEPIEDEPVDDEVLPTPEEEDEGVPEDEDLGEDLPEDEPVDDVEDDSDFQTEDDGTEQEIDNEFEDSELPDEDDVITDEPSDIDSASEENEPSLDENLTEGDATKGTIGSAATGAAIGSVVPGVGTAVGAGIGAGAQLLKNLNKESYLMEDVAMDPNANLGAPPPAAPAPMPPAPPVGDPNAMGAAPAPIPPAGDPNAAPPMDPTMDPNAAAGAPADPNAPMDPNDPNAQAPEGEGENPEQQDPILDVDSNVVASDTSTPQEDNQQPVPTQESVMESLITELGSYMDGSNADVKDLLSQDVDD